MTVDTLIAALGLIIALYTFFDEKKRVKLKLGFGLIDYTFFSAVLVTATYLVLFDLALEYNMTLGLGLHKYGIQIDHASFVIFSFSILYLWIRVNTKSVPLSRVDGLLAKLNSYLQEKKYSKLTGLLEDYSKFLISLSRKKRSTWKPFLFIQKKYESYSIYDVEAHYINEIEQNDLKTTEKVAKWFWRLLRYNRLINYKIESIEYIVERISTFFFSFVNNKEYIENLAKSRPYLFIDFDEIVPPLRNDLYKNFLYYQFSFDYSALQNELRVKFHKELDDNKIAYRIDSQTALLNFFFSKEQRFDELLIAFEILSILEFEISSHLNDQKSENKYLNPPDSFSDVEKYDPIYLYLILFDITVRSHIKFDVPWHSEVYKLVDVVDVIIANIDKGKGKIRRELPTLYHDIVHQIIKLLIDWAKLIEREVSENLKVKSDNPHKTNNGSIGRAFTETLAKIVLRICSSPKFQKKFKKLIVKELLTYYYTLTPITGDKKYDSLLVNCFRDYGGAKNTKMKFIDILSEIDTEKEEQFRKLSVALTDFRNRIN